MRTDDFEERLRQALQTRAADVRPDPTTWLRVRDRIERRQRPRWVTALAAVAPLVIAVFAAAAVFGLLGRDRDVLLSPSASPSPSATEAAEVPAAMVLAAEPGIVMADAAGQSLVTLYEAPAVTVARPRPSVQGEEPVVAYLEESEPCLGQVGVTGGPSLAATGTICPTAPAWSPDGAFVAFLQRFSEGGWGLSVAPFGGQAGEVQELQGDGGLTQVRLHAWVWDEIADGLPSGYLVLTATEEDGEIGMYRLPVAMSGSEVVVAGAVSYLERTEGLVALANGSTEPVSAEGSTYRVQVVDGRPQLQWTGEGESPPALSLPDEVLDPSAPDGQRVWLTASGDTVLFGDGVDAAWLVERRGGEWAPLQRLPGTIRFADLLVELAPDELPAPAPAPSPQPASSAQPTPTPTPSAAPTASATPSPTATVVPPAVASTREALLAAASARSYDQLAALLPSDGDFTSNYGGTTDHIAFYRQEEENGIDVFAELAAVLTSGPGTYYGTEWVWPADYAQPTADYLGYRVGIDPSGTWRFFVAGD